MGPKNGLVMKPPEQDLTDRVPVWDEFHMLFMDTDVTLWHDRIVEVCIKSKYSVDELEAILFNEVLPGLRFNLWLFPAPEWRGFETEWLKQRILNKHRFGKRRPLLGRRYTQRHWRQLRPRIEAKEASCQME